MASPSVKTGKNRTATVLPLRLHLALPLVTRRCAAVLVEVSLVTASALVPYSIGLYAKYHSTAELVPLNPLLASTEEAIAKTLAYPRGQLTRQVPPLTNLCWSIALLSPVAVATWQLYLLAKRGQTSPKVWFGVQVVTGTGEAPGIARTLVREGIGRWGIPLSTAYLIWRYTGAFPDLGILLGLVGLTLLAESISAILLPRLRTLHDRLAGTYVLGISQIAPPAPEGFHNGQFLHYDEPVRLEVQNNWEESNGHGQDRVTTIILTTQPERKSLSLWLWMRHNPGMTLLIMAVAGMASVLGTFVGTQIYIQSQANRREFKQQNNEVFLTLVKQLSSSTSNATEDRRGAILALARQDDPRAVPLLVDLLAQEKNESLIDSIQQALVSTGSQALPYLQRLNQSLQSEKESLRQGGMTTEQRLANVRQQASQRAIAKILTVYSGQLHNADLSRTNLAQVTTAPAQFALVLDRMDLSGINFRSAILSNASLRESKFYGAGDDGRIGTFDDWVSDLSGADLKQADLSGANLQNVALNQTNLMRATLNRANLSDTRMVGANLSSAQLISADLSRTVLENASLTGANLGEAKLLQSNLQRARLGQVNAVGTQFPFANLRQSNWQGADLTGANFANANLQEADLSFTKLVRADLKNANLQDVTFRQADLSTADLRGANLAGADFQDATFALSRPIKSDQFIQAELKTTSGAQVQGVDFGKATNLSSKQIDYICDQGGQHPQCN
jgi:uncharacterized protein YjbI with pentapeptide repeats/uncharacterized RDD family membrane protein YckC